MGSREPQPRTFPPILGCRPAVESALTPAWRQRAAWTTGQRKIRRGATHRERFGQEPIQHQCQIDPNPESEQSRHESDGSDPRICRSPAVNSFSGWPEPGGLVRAHWNWRWRAHESLPLLARTALRGTATRAAPGLLPYREARLRTRARRTVPFDCDAVT